MILKPRHYWLALLLAGALVCVVALSLRTHSAAAGSLIPQSASAQTLQAPVSTATYEGIVTDTRCGAKHSAKVDLSAADCTRFCVHNGERFALVDGDKMYVLTGDRERLKRLAGERVAIAGSLSGNEIKVASVSEANPKTD